MRRCHTFSSVEDFDKQFGCLEITLHSCPLSSRTKYKSPSRSAINFISPLFLITVTRVFVNIMSQFLSVIFPTNIKFFRRSGIWNTLLKLAFSSLPSTFVENNTVPLATIYVKEVLPRLNILCFVSWISDNTCDSLGMCDVEPLSRHQLFPGILLFIQKVSFYIKMVHICYFCIIYI